MQSPVRGAGRRVSTPPVDRGALPGIVRGSNAARSCARDGIRARAAARCRSCARPTRSSRPARAGCGPGYRRSTARRCRAPGDYADRRCVRGGDARAPSSRAACASPRVVPRPMAKDVRALRHEAAEATTSGKYKRALAAYLEPRAARAARGAVAQARPAARTAGSGNSKNAIEAFNRSAERYAQSGFLVQAIAVCKIVLQIDPQHVDIAAPARPDERAIGQGPTRAAATAENNRRSTR